MEFMEDVLVNVIDEEIEEIKKNFDLDAFEEMVVGKTMEEIKVMADATKVPYEMGSASITFEILDYNDNNALLFMMDGNTVSDTIQMDM